MLANVYGVNTPIMTDFISPKSLNESWEEMHGSILLQSVSMMQIPITSGEQMTVKCSKIIRNNEF